MMTKLIRGVEDGELGGIVVQTRRGTNIENFQAHKISPLNLAAVQSYKKRHPLAIVRSRPSAIYNCHGLTFASRRTRISESKEVAKVLAEDDYVAVAAEDVKPGDIVVYSRNGDLRHSGIVLYVKKTGGRTIPMLLSKWGDGHEAIHSQFDCPYIEGTSVKYYRIEE